MQISSSELFFNFLYLHGRRNRINNETMAGFNIKNELGNVGGQVAQSGINRLVDMVIDLVVGLVRKRTNSKNIGTRTTFKQKQSVPPQPPVSNKEKDDDSL